MSSSLRLSRYRMEEITHRDKRIQDVYSIPTSGGSRLMWFVQHIRMVLECRISESCRPVDDVLRMCRTTSDCGVNEAILVAMGLVLCEDWRRVDFLGHVWNHGGTVVDVLLDMVEDIQEVGEICMDIVKHISRYGVGEGSKVEHVAYCIRHCVWWLTRQQKSPTVLECVGALDRCLLSLPAEYVDTIKCSIDVDVYEWIDSYLKEESDDVGPLYQLRARFMLMGCVNTPVQGRHHHHHHQNADDGISPSDISLILDAMLHWNPKTRMNHDECEKTSVVARIAWLVCSTYSLSQGTKRRIYSANPFAYPKILENILDKTSLKRGHVDNMLCWVLASHIDTQEEQQNILQWDIIPRLEHYDDPVRCMYPWVERQMLVVENKVSIDDTSVSGAVVGGHEHDALRTLRTLLFPCVLFCPYSTLHSVYSMDTLHRNDAWLFVALLNVFPHLVSLTPLQQTCGTDFCASTEISRLILDGIQACSAQEDSLPYIQTFKALVKAQERGDVSLQDVRDGLVTFITRQDVDTCVAGAAECLKQLWSVPTDTEQAVSIISACLHHLEFSTRYTRLVPLKKETLQDLQDIIEETIGSLPLECQHHVLGKIETHGAYPWARLYFGFEFSDADAYYILHVNPKPGDALLHHDVYKVGNIRMHQTLELAALGSVHAKELCSLVAEYSSRTMDDFRQDLIDSLRFLCTVCTCSEMMHLITSLEIICSDLLVHWMRAHNDDMSLAIAHPNLVSSCCAAMVVELCIKSALSTCPPHYRMISEVCQYSVSVVKSQTGSLGSMLMVRIFSEFVACYACICIHNSTSDEGSGDACTSIESVISILCSIARNSPGMHCRLMADAIKQHVTDSSHFIDAMYISLTHILL